MPCRKCKQPGHNMRTCEITKQEIRQHNMEYEQRTKQINKLINRYSQTFHVDIYDMKNIANCIDEISTYVVLGSGDIDEIELCISRAAELLSELNAAHVRFRRDSKLCKLFILGVEHDCAKVVRIMTEMNFLYRFTNYRYIQGDIIRKAEEIREKDGVCLTQEERANLVEKAKACAIKRWLRAESIDMELGCLPDHLQNPDTLNEWIKNKISYTLPKLISTKHSLTDNTSNSA